MDMASRLDLFLDVVQKGSFAKAANARNIDRSALSKQIKILEQELGVRLLNRSTRALSPRLPVVASLSRQNRLERCFPIRCRLPNLFMPNPRAYSGSPVRPCLALCILKKRCIYL